ncbi:MAG: ester cyclase [Proteobacteria bacterium]|nr:ester cyclase [Pseudomonadota bacterium]
MFFVQGRFIFRTGRALGDLARTGNRIEMRDTSIKKIVDGKFAESWGTIDSLSMMQQLGLLPKG